MKIKDGKIEMSLEHYRDKLNRIAELEKALEKIANIDCKAQCGYRWCIEGMEELNKDSDFKRNNCLKCAYYIAKQALNPDIKIKIGEVR